jgi:dCMP deaminase
MDMAIQASTRATCPRKSVGSVIVKDKHVISTGYNGSIPGGAHCSDVGCMMEDSHCVRVVHSELNAILQAAKHGASTNGATIYVTASPCWGCFKAIVTAGIVKIVFGTLYRDERIVQFALSAGIELVNMNLEKT